jgi:phage N-6-adenine-methyltransferase
MDRKTRSVMFSSATDEWATPQSIFDKLNKKYNFTLDPCCTHANAKCEKHYTIEEDGLSQSWAGESVFVNPPYSNIADWVKKAHYESTENGATVALLIPSRTDTKYWHDYIMESASTIYFIKGRVKFESANKENKNSAPFPSAVIVFGEYSWSPGIRLKTMER